tara:strand:- start:131 stop:550 length:420 start_codon:yes stop_codon:yes gene_type:complete
MMVSTLDMKDIRYINLFTKITRVNTRYFFEYNNMLVFCVPRKLLSKAVGPDAKNLRKMSDILKKRIRVVAQPKDISDAKSFIESIIAPVGFTDIEINNDEIVVTGGKQHKAALIGRNKRRLNEMKQIIKYFFKRDFRIA